MDPTTLRLQYTQRFKNSNSPLIGMFELTGRCNFDCKMCYVHTKSNAEFMQTEKDGDWWIAQIDAACKMGMLFATLSGGECLMHPDFQRIYLHLREKGVFTQINTNGLLLNSKNIEFLKKNPPLVIQVTLYAADDKAYEQVTGVRAFKQVEKNILQAREAGLNLCFSVTPNKFAPDETVRIVEYIKGMDIPYTINDALFSPYDELEKQTISGKEVGIYERIRYLAIEKDIEPIPMNESDLPLAGGDRSEEVRGLQCTGGRLSFVVTHDGCMMPCTSMYHLRVPVNTADEFETVWMKMLEINKTYKMPVECEGCAYKDVCLSCPVLRGGKIGNGHCDPAVCEMTRALVAAGVKKLK